MMVSRRGQRIIIITSTALGLIACYVPNRHWNVVEAYAFMNQIHQSSSSAPFILSGSTNPWRMKPRGLNKAFYPTKQSTSITTLLWSQSSSEGEEVTTTQPSSSSSLPDITTMRIKEIKEELDSYGISTKSFLEKSELITALEKARAEGKKPISHGKKDSPSSTTTSSSSSSSSNASITKEERFLQEMEKCQQMKVSELRKELAQLGISTKTFVEKSEFVRALAEARVEGVKKKDEEDVVVVANNVEVLGANDAGPQKRSSQDTTQQQRQSTTSPFGGMGGFADIFTNMGGMGGGNMADMFNGMGGGNMADMFNGMGGGGGSNRMPNMAKFQQMMTNPKVRQIIAKAQNDPRIMSAIRECIANPMAMSKYQNDPIIRDLLNELRPFLS